ncbi:MAG: hypothetical protein NTZ65_00630 [Candidatus Berkelbacteria bacterium]|nr:hypothetical protein [Candidatus Berkelbacteria bacterium]
MSKTKLQQKLNKFIELYFQNRLAGGMTVKCAFDVAQQTVQLPKHVLIRMWRATQEYESIVQAIVRNHPTPGDAEK